MNVRQCALPSVILSAVLLAVAACDDAGPISPPADGLSLSQPVQAPPMAAEAFLLDLAERIAGFGGYFFDENDDLVVQLTDERGRGVAASLLQPLLDRRQASERRVRNPAATVRFAPARHTYMELRAWRERLDDPLAEVEGVLYSGIHMRTNRLAIGALPEAHGGVEELLRSFGMPVDAYELEDVQYISEGPLYYEEPTTLPPSGTHLESFFRPLEGGIQIAHRTTDLEPGYSLACTLGVPVWWDGGPGFLTASHCSEDMWSTDGTLQFQPTIRSDGYVGYEAHDPRPYSCGPFWAYKCRHSDAAIVRVTSGVDIRLGYIARTRFAQFGRTGDGSKEIDPDNPRFRITRDIAPYEGQEIDKMGRSRGWTFGDATRTCQTYYPEGWRRLRCQTFATYGSFDGDSGGPVFDWKVEGYGDRIRLAGTHVGSIYYDDGSSVAVFSPIANIRDELGSFSTVPTSSGGSGGSGGGDDCDSDPDDPLIVEPC